jgi:Pyridoxamine 5'-phosphate oxidase
MTELTWDEIAGRFDAARNWWVATSGGGGPHAVPVWGVVVDSVLLFYGEASAVRTRNLAADPRLVAHLEDGDAPLIVHGTAAASGPAADHPGAVAGYAAKYTGATDLQYLPDQPAMGEVLLFTVTPLRAITWDLDAFETSDRRWRADPRG